MKHFNRKVFTTASMITGLLVVLCLFAVLEDTGGAHSGGMLATVLGGLFNILRFPVLTFFSALADTNSIFFCAGFVINCLLYGLLYERIHTFFRVRKMNKDHIT